MASSRQADENVQEGAAPVATPHANVAETRWPPLPLRRHAGGFWLPEVVAAEGLPAVHSCFVPRPTDVILASYSKSGTTWLKALAFATLRRSTHPPSDDDHPLRRFVPHDCVRYLELGTGLVRYETLAIHNHCYATILEYPLSSTLEGRLQSQTGNAEDLKLKTSKDYWLTQVCDEGDRLMYQKAFDWEDNNLTDLMKIKLGEGPEAEKMLAGGSWTRLF